MKHNAVMRDKKNELYNARIRKKCQQTVPFHQHFFRFCFGSYKILISSNLVCVIFFGIERHMPPGTSVLYDLTDYGNEIN